MTTKPIFTKVPEEYLDTYYSYFDLHALRNKYHQKKHGFKVMYAREHPVVFAYFCLGKKLRPYQAFAIDKILENSSIAMNWARRLGKSTICAILALWMTYFNKFPKNSMEKFTVVGIVSKENDAAKKLLSNVRQLLGDGDMQWLRISKGTPYEEKSYYTKKLVEPNNAEQITWGNGSIIKSFPPTKKVKGWGFSYLFIDEMAYLDPKDEDSDSFYNLTCRPTLAECGGRLVIASTPSGRSGTYYEIFDPNDERDSQFLRLWFNWTMADGDAIEEVQYRQWVEAEKARLQAEGKDATFRQEFMGDFTVIQNSFFEHDDIQSLFDSKMVALYEWHKSPCSIGIDFGISTCKTITTIKTKWQGKIITLYQRVFPVGFDNNELMNPNNDESIPSLFKRYDVEWLVPEESSVSDMFVKWCKREGYPVFPYRFTNSSVMGGKNRAYHTYRAMLRRGDMKSYPLELLKNEMMSLQEKQEKVNWIIGKPSGGTDDAIDSDVFATTPFFEDEGSGIKGMWDGSAYEGVVKTGEFTQVFDYSSRGIRHDNGIKEYKDGIHVRVPFGQ